MKISLYPFIAEDVRFMRPFDWVDLPETHPYVEGEPTLICDKKEKAKMLAYCK